MERKLIVTDSTTCSCYDAHSKKISKRTKVGVAHHVSFMRPYGLFDVPLVMFSDHFTRFAYVDDVCKKLDYLGINYYGQVNILN